MEYSPNIRNSVHMRTYSRKEAVIFRKTKEEFGGLSNMAAGFPLVVNGSQISTSEALYQACRFPHMPEVQRIIIGQRSPMTAKMKSKPYRRRSRADWDQVKLEIMLWCLRVKLAQNWTKFGKLLLETGNRPIVEESHRDDFWGAKAVDGQTLIGFNALGRLIMRLRDKLKQNNRESLSIVKPLTIPDFLLDGEPIGTVFGYLNKEIEAVDSLPVKAQIAIGSFQRNDDSLSLNPTGQDSLFDDSGSIARNNRLRKNETNEFRKYHAYKDSGVPWMGKIPAHWQVLPNRAIFKEINESGYPDEQMLSVTITQGVIQQTSLLRDTSKKDSSNEDKSKYKLVCPGDIAYNKMRAWQGAVGASSCRGIVSPAYIVVRPREKHNPRFFHYLFRTPAFTREAERWSYGISSDQWSLRPEEFKQIYCCVPTLPEQTTIVRYLDYMGSRIRRYITDKKTLIALLNEQKQAIIQQAVTLGLDPNVRLKPSGVPWLENVPQHWDILKIKYTTYVKGRIGWHGLRSDEFCANGPFLVTGTDFIKGKVDWSNCYHISESRFMEDPYIHLKEGDLLITKDGSIGKVALIINLPNKATLNSGIFLTRPLSNKYLTHYMYWLLQSNEFFKYIEFSKLGATVQHLYQVTFGNFTFALPPLREQPTISEFLEYKIEDINHSIDLISNMINKMREYRTRLITDVVTGKLDVREAAANLPEEAEAEEQLEEIDSLTEIEEMTEEGDLEPAIAEVTDED